MQIRLGEKIRTLRKQKGLSQDVLASALGVSFQAVSKWEKADSMPDVTLIPAIASFFGVSTDELFDFELELGRSVSNNIDVVYSNFLAVSTNIVERRLLLASAWRLGDDHYLDCLSRNVDLAIGGVITSEDLEWYMRGHRTRHLTYLLASQYDRPGVSNIVLRLIAYTGETNKYEKVLSGEAKAEYLEFEQFMADGPEAPRQNE